MTYFIHVWHDSSICVTWLMQMFEMTQPYVWHDSLPSLGTLLLMTSCVTWLVDMCDMTRWYVWHDSLDVWHDSIDLRRNSLTYATWLIYMCDMTHLMCDMNSSIRVTWLIAFSRHVTAHDKLCDMTHPYAWQFIHFSDFLFATLLTYLIWLIQMCDMTHPYAWHDSSICVTWLIYMCDMIRCPL